MTTVADRPTSEPELLRAVAQGNVAEVNRLLSFGINPNTKDAQGRQVLWLAVAAEKPEIVQALLAAGANVNARTDDRKSTALRAAARAGHADIVSMLVKAGVEVNARTNCGETALLLAAESGHIEVVRMLLGAGARANIRSHSKGWRRPARSPLEAAANNGHTEVVKLLLG